MDDGHLDLTTVMLADRTVPNLATGLKDLLE